jgi:hypothetical protein
MGPMGMGPRSGRAAGYCTGSDGPGFASPWFGRGRRWGLGRGGGGRGRGFGGWRRGIGRLSAVNPRIRAHGVRSEEAVESCLSLPGVEVPVTRPSVVKLRGRTAEGKALSLVAEGLWARVVQHELDHLDGRLISDRAPAAVGPRGEATRA